MDLSFNTFIVVARHVSLDLVDHRTISVKQKIERVQSLLKPMNVITRSVCLGQNPVLSGGVAKPTVCFSGRGKCNQDSNIYFVCFTQPWHDVKVGFNMFTH
ncbi:unnamed protein product [Calypogeia fissa]